jgi:cyclopropane fatty-acyl-phospholipid synthase-like methyltransferase
MFRNEDIEQYYDLSEVHYKLFWNLEESRSLHYGYWDKNTKNFHEALLNINSILSQFAEIKANEKVLDAGCGVGGSSQWLGVNIGCQVIGISLSQKQVNKANLISKNLGLDSKVNFEKRDFINTGFADNSFDVVWAIESVCHANNKSDFLKEAYRILKKGGRLIMADFFKKENLKGEDASIIHKWATGWAVPDFSTMKDFQSKLQEEGFKEVTIQDATEAIRPSASRLYKAYWIGWLGANLYRLFHPKASEFGKRNVETAYYQYKGLKRDLWKYHIVLAKKN